MGLSKPPSGYAREDTEIRRKWLAEQTGFEYDDALCDEPEDLKGIIENHLGFMSIPMAIASPLLLNGAYAQGEFCVPVCTLEGSLVLSMSRGMLAASLCGGITTRHFRQEISRSPVFLFDDIGTSASFLPWIDDHYEEIKKAAESTTRHGRLLRIDKYPLQNWVILDFVYSTSNAAGQNMITIASEEACRYIKSKTGHDYIVESGFNSDKKASARSMMHGRGHSVIAEVTITNSVLRRVLGTDPERVAILQQVAPPATRLAGTEGAHLHVANALTAIYLATGQDTACVAENAIGQTQTTPADGGTHICLTLPSLTVGTVGGGTRLKKQQNNLRLLGCHEGEHSAKKLAEIICASALALEISLMAAISSGTFASSHQTYGRP